MIASPVSRRTLMAAGFVTTALTGCSVDLTTPARESDPDAADRSLISQARDRSQTLLDIVTSTMAQQPATTTSVNQFQVLHTRQIAVFTSSARLIVPSQTPMIAPAPVSLSVLVQQERALADALRGLALQAQRGDVGSLLASAAAGINQAVMAVHR